MDFSKAWEFVFLLVTGISLSNAYFFEKQIQNTGMIYIPLSKAQVTYTQWNLIYYYELNSYFEESKKFEQCITKLSTICNNNLQDEDSASQVCEYIIKQLTEQLNDIRIDENMIKSYSIPTTNSQKKLGSTHLWRSWMVSTYHCELYQWELCSRLFPPN